MRIALFTETFLPNTDGIVTRLCATLGYLEEEGHEVLLFAPEGGPKHYASATIIGLPSFRFLPYPEKRFSLPKPVIGRCLREFQPDLIHAVNPAFLGLGAIYYAWRYRIPLVESYHTNVPAYARHYHLNWLEPSLWWYFRLLHNRADINLCTSRATLRELEKQRFRNVGLWERGVDVDLYSAAKSTEAMRRKLAPSAKSTDKIMLYVGRLAAEKDIESVRALLHQRADVHFAIVGDGPHRQPLEEWFKGTQTEFIGYMHGTDLADAYASADGFLFPSTTETLGLVLFEAMASGVPIMAADSPPTREVLEGGAAGFIYDASDSNSIHTVLETLLEDVIQRARVQSRARALASELDWKVPTKQLLDHYVRLLAHAPQLAKSKSVSESQL